MKSAQEKKKTDQKKIKSAQEKKRKLIRKKINLNRKKRKVIRKKIKSAQEILCHYESFLLRHLISR